MNLIFDTHAHYDDQSFNEDRKELLSGLFENGVGMVVNAGAAARSMPGILDLTLSYDFLYGAAGLHPCETYCCGDNRGEPVMYLTGMDGSDLHKRSLEDGRIPEGFLAALDRYEEQERITEQWQAGEREMAMMRALLTSSRFVAVGEIGLDYHYEDTQKQLQQEWFARQIALAREVNRPIIVHSRDAAADTLDMIRSEQARDVGGIIHCFSYGKEMAEQYLNLDFMIGIGGVVTYKNARKIKEVVEYVPMDHLVLETDCPYLAPTPFRGKRNDSTLIKYAAEAIGEIKGMEADAVIGITAENARRLFRIERES